MSRTPRWIAIAVASGLCAAANGMFAKLTTTKLTTSIAGAIAHSVGLSRENKIVEFGIRAMFFGLNLFFNGIMWALFTSALKRSPSTTRVSIVNTSANFLFSALLGLLIFSEALPPLWWLGAALLVVGNFFVGRRGDDKEKGEEGRNEELRDRGEGGGEEEEEVREDEPLLAQRHEEDEEEEKDEDEDEDEELDNIPPPIR